MHHKIECLMQCNIYDEGMIPHNFGSTIDWWTIPMSLASRVPKTIGKIALQPLGIYGHVIIVAPPPKSIM